MSPQQLKSIGIFLGILVVILAVLHLVATIKAGDANWYFLVMVCGMLLLLYYTVFTGGRRRRR